MTLNVSFIMVASNIMIHPEIIKRKSFDEICEFGEVQRKVDVIDLDKC